MDDRVRSRAVSRTVEDKVFDEEGSTITVEFGGTVSLIPVLLFFSLLIGRNSKQT